MPTAPCPACGSTSRVTIGKKDYCTNCGSQLTGQADEPVALPSVTPISNAAAATAAVPAAVAPTAPTPAETGTAVQVNPAQAFHAKPAPSNHVLDLRKAPVTPPPVPKAEPLAIKTEAVPTSAIAPAISKFHNPNAKISTSPVNEQATEKPEKVVLPPTPASVVAAPASAPAAPVATPATPPVNDVAAPKDMPASVSTAISSNQNLLAVAKNAATPAQNAPRPASMAVAAIGLVLLGGYVWLKNYPNLAIRVAATKAGIAAAAPAYLPSGYSLSGQVTYSPGEVTTNFNSPSGTGTLTIIQRRTSWDSDSLLDNFVARQGNDFLAVQREGLTVYFYGQNQVTWINHGIWYTIQGTNKLNRDQVLSIVDSL